MQIAEAAVTVALRMNGAIVLPQQRKRHARALEFTVDLGPIRLRLEKPTDTADRVEQQRFQLSVRHLRSKGPGERSPFNTLQISTKSVVWRSAMPKTPRLCPFGSETIPRIGSAPPLTLHGQARLYRGIAVVRPPTALSCRRRSPRHLRIEPDGQGAALPQRFVVSRPVLGLVARRWRTAQAPPLPRWSHNECPAAFAQRSHWPLPLRADERLHRARDSVVSPNTLAAGALSCRCCDTGPRWARRLTAACTRGLR